MTDKRPLCNYSGTIKEMVAGDVVTGHDTYHGIQAAGTISFDGTEHVLTLASVTYWYAGTSYTKATPTTCDLDLTADRDHASASLTDNTLYYIYFKDATGKLYWSPVFWNLLTTVPVATVFWNGTAGSLAKETHGYSRNIDWHIWAHLTVGCRYGAGLDKTYPTTTNDGSLQIETGTVYDEDLVVTTGQQTTMRGWYRPSAGAWTFANYALPYTGIAGAPTYLDTDTYVLTTFASNRYACYWVFATTDVDRPISIIPTHASAAYSQVTTARAETQPSISGVNPEWKLIYRWIYSGDGQFVESSDYRLQTSLAGAVSSATTAGAVSFSPSGNVAATTVQGAIEELDTEKAPALLTGFISGAGVVAATDTVLAAIQKLDGNIESIETGGTVGLFDLDINGALQPVETSNTDEFWEIDINGALIPKASAGETVPSKYFGAVFDGGGLPISAGKKVFLRVPSDGTIVGCWAIADVSGTISIEVWKDTFANFPPTVADKISASVPIDLSSAQSVEITTLTGWTTTVTAGDVICLYVSALATSITWCSAGLIIQ